MTTTELMKMREREIWEQDREAALVESDRKIAEIAKSLIASAGWSVAEAFKSMGLSAEDQARVKQYM